MQVLQAFFIKDVRSKSDSIKALLLHEGGVRDGFITYPLNMGLWSDAVVKPDFNPF